MLILDPVFAALACTGSEPPQPAPRVSVRTRCASPRAADALLGRLDGAPFVSFEGEVIAVATFGPQVMWVTQSVTEPEPATSAEIESLRGLVIA